MGRAKLEIKPIQKSTNRQITYSKRKKGLLKKAYELSTLCDIDLALLMFSPSDRLCLFSSQTRIEDVLAKYINLPDQEREKYYLLRTLEQLKTENDMAFQINEPRHEAIHSDVEELQKEVCRLQRQLQISEEELRKFEPDPVRFTSMEEMEACETHLLSTLTRVVHRREHLLSRSCEAPSTQQSMENIEGWEPEAESKQARIIANSAYASNQLRRYICWFPSYDLLLQGSNSNPTQTPK
ncbi:hypothetical protein Bca4012_058212 [Brassica carinata]|uniref:MADS-box domain-containing protein n=1 Tax=Brassica carinata TaxID=52824 RepID=A0A8X8B648_BRACI|nr:hypothetical protein Bca52824_015965 [Brassica carinata]